LICRNICIVTVTGSLSFYHFFVILSLLYHFYRAMHYSAKRGLWLWLHVVRPSVWPSVTLADQDHIGWKSWKLIPRTIIPPSSLIVAQRPCPYPRATWGNFEESRGGVGKTGVLEHKSGNISETRKDRGKVTMEAYRNSPTLFRTVPSPTPTASSSPRLGVRNPTQNFNRHYLKNR